MRSEHQATLLAIRRHGRVYFNAGHEFAVEPADVLVVIAEHLGRLVPAPHLSDSAAATGVAPLVPTRDGRLGGPVIEAPSTPQGS